MDVTSIGKIHDLLGIIKNIATIMKTIELICWKKENRNIEIGD